MEEPPSDTLKTSDNKANMGDGDVATAEEQKGEDPSVQMSESTEDEEEEDDGAGPEFDDGDENEDDEDDEDDGAGTEFDDGDENEDDEEENTTTLLSLKHPPGRESSSLSSVKPQTPNILSPRKKKASTPKNDKKDSSKKGQWNRNEAAAIKERNEAAKTLQQLQQKNQILGDHHTALTLFNQEYDQFKESQNKQQQQIMEDGMLAQTLSNLEEQEVAQIPARRKSTRERRRTQFFTEEIGAGVAQHLDNDNDSLFDVDDESDGDRSTAQEATDAHHVQVAATRAHRDLVQKQMAKKPVASLTEAQQPPLSENEVVQLLFNSKSVAGGMHSNRSFELAWENIHYNEKRINVGYFMDCKGFHQQWKFYNMGTNPMSVRTHDHEDVNPSDLFISLVGKLLVNGYPLPSILPNIRGENRKKVSDAELLMFHSLRNEIDSHTPNVSKGDCPHYFLSKYFHPEILSTLSGNKNKKMNINLDKEHIEKMIAQENDKKMVSDESNLYFKLKEDGKSLVEVDLVALSKQERMKETKDQYSWIQKLPSISDIARQKAAEFEKKGLKSEYKKFDGMSGWALQYNEQSSLPWNNVKDDFKAKWETKVGRKDIFETSVPDTEKEIYYDHFEQKLSAVEVENSERFADEDILKRASYYNNKNVETDENYDVEPSKKKQKITDNYEI